MHILGLAAAASIDECGFEVGSIRILIWDQCMYVYGSVMYMWCT